MTADDDARWGERDSMWGRAEAPEPPLESEAVPPDWTSPWNDAVPTDRPTEEARQPTPWWRTRRPTSGQAAVLVLVAALVIGVAFAMSRRTSTVQRSASQTSTPGFTAPTGDPGRTPPSTPADNILSGLVLHQSDVVDSLTVDTIRGGTDTTGEVTLDLCNADFPSERLRAARLQVVAADQAGDVALSTEAVLYTSTDGGAQAMAELTLAAQHCPAGPVRSAVGEPDAATHFNPSPDGSWPSVPSVDRQAHDFTATDAAGGVRHLVAVYLRRGRVLMGLYFQQPDSAQPAVDGQTTIAGIVDVFAKRLAQLPVRAANGIA